MGGIFWDHRTWYNEGSIYQYCSGYSYILISSPNYPSFLKGFSSFSVIVTILLQFGWLWAVHSTLGVSGPLNTVITQDHFPLFKILMFSSSRNKIVAVWLMLNCFIVAKMQRLFLYCSNVFSLSWVLTKNFHVFSCRDHSCSFWMILRCLITYGVFWHLHIT